MINIDENRYKVITHEHEQYRSSKRSIKENLLTGRLSPLLYLISVNK